MKKPVLLWPRVCTGSPEHPGCGKAFKAPTAYKKFCPECSALDRRSSFVFVERRRMQRAVNEGGD